MERIISKDFIRDLESGILRNILKYVKSDLTLAMEIRQGYTNIYYRGGSLLKIKEVGPGIYNGYFDKNYINEENNKSVVVECISNIDSVSKANKLIEYIPKIKQQMDLWMKVEMPDGGEREYKHIVAKENNYGLVGRDSDYFIGDIEYTGGFNTYLFDMVGVKWSVNNLDQNTLDLALFNMYYGEKNLKSVESILRSLENIKEFLYDKSNLEALKADLKDIFNIKSSLGLLYPYKEVEIGFSDKVEIIYIFANQVGDNLKEILMQVVNSKEYEALSELVDIKVATSSFMGYGLYQKNMIDMKKIVQSM